MISRTPGPWEAKRGLGIADCGLAISDWSFRRLLLMILVVLLILRKGLHRSSRIMIRIRSMSGSEISRHALTPRAKAADALAETRLHSCDVFPRVGPRLTRFHLLLQKS